MTLRAEFTLEAANRRGIGHLPELFGFRVTAIDEEKLAAEIDVRPQILAPNGYLHAATIVALADTSCGMAASRIFPPTPPTSPPSNSRPISSAPRARARLRASRVRCTSAG
jgi:acyl-coenzyme A thioesterase PaaI-like protein